MPDEPESLNSPEAISEFLQGLGETRHSITISPGRSSASFNSKIIQVDRSRLHIEQLDPEAGNVLMRPGRIAEVRLSVGEASYLFRTNPISYSVDEQDQPYHQVSLPEEIKYLKKRASYRIYLRLTQRPKIKISLESGAQLDAHIENISDTGASLRVGGANGSIKSDAIIQCDIQLPNIDLLSCQGLVRHCGPLGNTDDSRLGVEFWQLSQTQIKQLRRALMKLQRHNIKSDLTL